MSVHCPIYPLPLPCTAFLPSKSSLAQSMEIFYIITKINRSLNIFCKNFLIFPHCFQNNVQISQRAIHDLSNSSLLDSYPFPCMSPLLQVYRAIVSLLISFTLVSSFSPTLLHLRITSSSFKTLYRFPLFREAFLEL